ncbi:hypothetical protein N9F34_02490 [Alphaproteobacteria bacterium]|nr:hypothetical protein [Alphaproteobacteria bacterium]
MGKRHTDRRRSFSGLVGDFAFEETAHIILENLRARNVFDPGYQWAALKRENVIDTTDWAAYFKRKMSISLEDISERYRFLLHHARGGRPTSIRQIGDSFFLFENNEAGITAAPAI